MNTLKPTLRSPVSTPRFKPLALGEIRQTAMGRFRVQVVDAKTGRVIRQGKWQPNLILNSGLDRIATESWYAQLTYAVAGTGNTPTKDLPDDPGDTYSQSGTTVTRISGTRDFSAGDIGKLIRWSGGQEATITAYTSATVVTVGTSQTVAAAPIDALYRVAQTGLATETKRSSTQPQFIDEDDGLTAAATTIDATAGTVTFKVTRDFSEESGNVNYTEVGMSSQASAGNNLFSRMLLSGAVTVGAAQLLRLKYELTIKCNGHAPASQTTVEDGFTGWPLPYNIVSIVSNGTYWEVTLDAAHHFLSGGKISINSAKRPRVDITAATSTVSNFTITAPGHGRSGGQTIVIEDMTPSGYNGSFTIASVSGDDIVVTSALNPGTGTDFGNVRQAEPGTWYDGDDYTIASVPSSTKVRITNATSIADAGADGTAYNNVNRKWIAVSYGVAGPTAGSYGAPAADILRALGGAGKSSDGASTLYSGIHDGSTSSDRDGYLLIPASHPSVLPNDFPQWYGQQTTSGTWAAISDGGVAQSPSVTNVTTSAATDTADPETYTSGNFYRDWIFVFGAGVANVQDIKMIAVGISQSPFNPSIQGYFLFEEPQRKKNTYSLSLTVRRSWGRDLTTIPN